MRRLLLLLACVLLVPSLGRAADVSLAWDANPPADPTCVSSPALTCIVSTTGYKIQYGILPGSHVVTIDVGNVPQGTAPNLSSGTTYYFTVVAYGPTGTSGPSNEVSDDPGDPACVFPTGAMSVHSVIVNYLPTGSGGPGSRGTLYFRASSPGSPIVHLAVQANGADISPADDANAHAPGDSVAAVAALDFTVPSVSGVYPLSLLGSNLYGCSNVQPSTFSITVP